MYTTLSPTSPLDTRAMDRDNLTNAKVQILKENEHARVIRVRTDGPRVKYLPGQYGSLGLPSEQKPGKLVKRAYSISSSIIDLKTKTLLDPEKTDYEIYFNKIPTPKIPREQLTPKLFQLTDEDRIFCGKKIVGHYTLEGVAEKKNILLIGTSTAEAPNNAIVNQLLLESRAVRVTQIVLGDPSWESLYRQEHELLQKLFDNYRFMEILSAKYETVERKIEECLSHSARSETFLGFPLDSETSHVFLCGDPLMIGAPKKLGAWNYEHAKSGLLRLFLAKGFTVKTRFQEGNIEYETYW